MAEAQAVPASRHAIHTHRGRDDGADSASFRRGEEAFGGGRLHDVARLEVRRSVFVAADASTNASNG
jgi:hypothetical protein